MTRPSWMPDNCTCDHLATDHARSQSGFPHPETYGPCLNPDCECERFEKAETSEACERHDPSPSESCPACGAP